VNQRGSSAGKAKSCVNLLRIIPSILSAMCRDEPCGLCGLRRPCCTRCAADRDAILHGGGSSLASGASATAVAPAIRRTKVIVAPLRIACIFRECDPRWAIRLHHIQCFAECGESRKRRGAGRWDKAVNAGQGPSTERERRKRLGTAPTQGCRYVRGQGSWGAICAAPEFRGLPVSPHTRPHSRDFRARCNMLVWRDSTERGLLFHYLICRRKAEHENQEDERQTGGRAPHYLYTNQPKADNTSLIALCPPFLSSSILGSLPSSVPR